MILKCVLLCFVIMGVKTVLDIFIQIFSHFVNNPHRYGNGNFYNILNIVFILILFIFFEYVLNDGKCTFYILAFLIIANKLSIFIRQRILTNFNCTKKSLCLYVKKQKNDKSVQ